MTHVHATIIRHPASVISLAITSLSLKQLVQFWTVSLTMTRTSALVLSTTCTATQQCIILVITNIRTKTNTSTIAGVGTVTAVLIRTPAGATVILHHASVRCTEKASLSLYHVIQSQSLTVCFIMTYTSALVLSTSMYCNTRMHDFSYQSNQNQYQCSNNNCDCRGNMDTCTCYSGTLSSCFCTNYNNPNTIPAAVSLVTIPDCVLHNDTYICTGAQYRMYCNTEMHDFSYQRYQYQYQYQCVNNNCNCIGNKDTCTCYSNTLSSCFCETYDNSIAVNREVTPAYGCVLYNDTYICTGAQYRMYCNTRMHSFNYQTYQYQCWNNTCNCIGNKDTCTCSSSTLSSCFCKTYGNSIALTTAVTPAYGCVLYNDTYICTGAQYHMYCNTRMHDFYYQRYRYQDQYQCVNNNCNCIGNKDTCACSISTLSCFCEYNISTPTTISPTAAGEHVSILEFSV